MDATIKQEIKGCKTLNEVLDVMDKYYDLDKPLGPMAKTVVLVGMEKVITATGTKRRK